MPRPEVRPPSPTSARGHRPGDDYNRRMSWSQLLEPHGWTIAFERHDIVYWRRPNKTVGVSATTNYGGSDPRTCSLGRRSLRLTRVDSKFAVYTILEHDGDFGRAALALFKAGCGDDVQDDDSLSTQTEASAAAASSSAAAARTVRLILAHTIAIRPVRWLWDDRLPLGAFASLGGREGVGKSILTYTLAADLTKGRLPGVSPVRRKPSSSRQPRFLAAHDRAAIDGGARGSPSCVPRRHHRPNRDRTPAFPSEGYNCADARNRGGRCASRHPRPAALPR